MTVIIYASCYQQNEGWTPSADPKGNLFSDPFRATRITVSVLLLEIRRVFFFSRRVQGFYFCRDRFENLSFL